MNGRLKFPRSAVLSAMLLLGVGQGLPVQFTATEQPGSPAIVDGEKVAKRPADIAKAEPRAARVNRRVHAFYYPWFGNLETDGAYDHWNHAVSTRSGPPKSYPGGEDIGANFYPALGCYSVNDPATLRKHMRQLRQARVGTICVSWWGKNSFTNRTLPALFDAAQKEGIRINFHIEPHIGPGGRNAGTVREAITYLLDRHGSHPALYRDSRWGNRTMFYLYDSYLTKAGDWATVFSPNGAQTIRGTQYDSIIIGLWVKEKEGEFFLKGHFDGFYTYFAIDGFTYGSTPANWKTLGAWARKNGKLFIPCVAPGYDDTRIRPWNGRNTRGRQKGSYYDREFEAAIRVEPDVIGITSFNEWHEGTQIEPAIPKRIANYKYHDYIPLEPGWYLDRTSHWVERFE